MKSRALDSQRKLGAFEGRLPWRSEAFRRWVRRQPCIFTLTVDERTVDPAHIHSKGSGADDFRNVVPVRNDLHRKQHDKGTWRFLLEHYGHDEEWLQIAADNTLIGWLERGE